MSSRRERELIAAYWYRTLLCLELSFDDIIKIVIEFGEAFECFEKSLMSQNMNVNDDGTILTQTSSLFKYKTVNAFGVFTAVPGHRYHWKVQLIQVENEQGKETRTNIGVIEADKYKENLDKLWCCRGNGYSYYSDDGDIYHEQYVGDKYGDKYSSGDIIDIRLDLKDNYSISWGKNGNDYGKGFNVMEEMEYKLAIGIYYGKVKLLSLEITE